MIDFFVENCCDILSLTISMCALVASIYANHRVNAIHRQDKQEPLYEDVKRLLAYKRDYHSAERKAMGCYPEVQRVSAEDEGRIKREVCRYFGKEECKQLCEILCLCDKAKNIDSDIGILFGLIKESDPKKYTDLGEILRQQYCVPEPDQESISDFLSTLSVPYYKLSEEDDGKAYDYIELNHSLEILDKQITEQTEKLKSKLKKISAKR